MTILLCGESGEAYSIAEKHSNITLKEMAVVIAGINVKEVVFGIPDAVEAVGYSTQQRLGWSSRYDIKIGIGRTTRILRQED